MVRFDAAGKVLRVDQVLDLKNVAALKVGTDTEQDVRRMFGRPGQVSGPHRVYGGPIWDYFAYDGQRRIIISASFDAAGRLKAAGEVPDPSDQSPAQAPHVRPAALCLTCRKPKTRPPRACKPTSRPSAACAARRWRGPPRANR